MKLSAFASCMACVYNLLRPLAAWVVTEVMPIPHHMMIGFLLVVFAMWRSRSERVPEATARRPAEC